MVQFKFKKVEFEGTINEIRRAARGRFNYEKRFKQFFKYAETTGLKKSMHSKFLKMKGFRVGRGIPDFYYTDEGTIKFIELKSFSDALQVSQMEWLHNHPNVDVTVIVFGFNKDSTDKIILYQHYLAERDFKEGLL